MEHAAAHKPSCATRGVGWRCTGTPVSPQTGCSRRLCATACGRVSLPETGFHCRRLGSTAGTWGLQAEATWAKGTWANGAWSPETGSPETWTPETWSTEPREHEVPAAATDHSANALSPADDIAPHSTAGKPSMPADTPQRQTTVRAATRRTCLGPAGSRPAGSKLAGSGLAGSGLAGPVSLSPAIPQQCTGAVCASRRDMGMGEKPGCPGFPSSEPPNGELTATAAGRQCSAAEVRSAKGPAHPGRGACVGPPAPH